MNKSGIEWTEFTSNPVSGKCRHACNYCYAERIRRRFKQTEKLSWHPERLLAIEKRKKPATIFMGSMHDIFGDWIPDKWIAEIIKTAKDCPQHTFLFLTKNPKRYARFVFPENCWLGYTDDGMQNLRNWVYMQHIKNTFVSFEPLQGNKLNVNFDIIGSVIIGAMTGLEAVKPERIWVEKIIEKAEGKPVFIKNNLLSIFPDLPRKQETAWILEGKEGY